MAEATQNVKNHARWLPAFHFFMIPVLLVNFFVVAWRLVGAPGLGQAFDLVVAAALVALGFLSRTQPLAAQDRVIRLEMRLRLHQVLPPALASQIGAITPRQLVALRFASDEELPALVADVVGGKLESQKDIKARIKNWQGDFLRV